MKEYAVVFSRGRSAWGGHVPDRPGCVAVAATLEEAEGLIGEAIEFHIEGMKQRGEDVPEPATRVKPLVVAAQARRRARRKHLVDAQPNKGSICIRCNVRPKLVKMGVGPVAMPDNCAWTRATHRSQSSTPRTQFSARTERQMPIASQLPIPDAPSSEGEYSELCGFKVPDALSTIKDVIVRARWILDLPNDWDGDGAPGYKEETWVRAACFLLQMATAYRGERLKVVPVPRFENGPEGSIDIYWRSEKRNLLINVAEDHERQAEFFGRRSDGSEIQGTLHTSSSNEWMLHWLES